MAAEGVKPVKAFIVETDDPEESTIQFATTNVAARRQGANVIDTSFASVSCKRLPWADPYAGQRIPESAFIANGWSYDCATCGHRVDQETTAPKFAFDLVFCCEKCHEAELTDRAAASARKQEVIDALLAKYPGVDVTYASDHEERRIAQFRFPGGKDPVEWMFGEDTVLVYGRDVDAWNAWREPFRSAAQLTN